VVGPTRMHARCASHGLEDTIVRPGGDRCPARAIDRTPARRSLGEHDPDKHSAERRGPAQCSEYGKPSAAARARMQRCRNTRRGDKTNLDDQCRLVAAGMYSRSASTFHTPVMTRTPNAGQATRLNARAATFVGSRPSARNAGTTAASVSCPPTHTVAANTWRNTRTVSQPTVSTDTANQLSAPFLSRPAPVGADGRTRRCRSAGLWRPPAAMQAWPSSAAAVGPVRRAPVAAELDKGRVAVVA
jgi:hypothetical protein